MLPISFSPVTSIDQLSAETQIAIVNLWNEFWSQVAVTDNPDDCWLWKGNNLDNGYGSFKHAGVSVHAYRMAWLLTHPEAPTGNGWLLRHLCGNRPCCNPHHLARGTVKENAQDRRVHGTQAIGSANFNAKLTEPQVYDILCEHTRDNMPANALAEKYRIDYGVIFKILKRTGWTHVPLPPDWKGYRTARQMKVDQSHKGSRIPHAKFTEEQVYQLRLDFLNGSLPAHLATQHHTAPKSMIRILCDGWRHVAFPPGWDGYEAISKRNLDAYYAERWAANRARKLERSHS